MNYSLGWERQVSVAVCLVLLIALSGALAAPGSQAAPDIAGDRTADRVLGQVDFDHALANQGLSGPTASTLSSPMGLGIDRSSGRIFVADWVNGRVQSWPNATTFRNGASADKSIKWNTLPLSLAPVATVTDSSGNLYVADVGNSRVLVYPPPYTSYSYTRVIGQPDFSSSSENQGGSPTEKTLSGPFGLAVDGKNHLFVADRNNNRVLRYTLPISVNNQAADLVLGYANFHSGPANCGYRYSMPSTASGLCRPQGVAVDGAGSVYVADTENNRIVRFSAPLSNGMAASLVLGQANFTGNWPNRGTAPTAQSLARPNGIAIDQYYRLYVADYENARVLGFEVRRASNGAAAKIVIGQPDFGPLKYSAPSQFSLAYPGGVAVDLATNVYVADTSFNRVVGYDTPWLWNIQLPFVIK